MIRLALIVIGGFFFFQNLGPFWETQGNADQSIEPISLSMEDAQGLSQLKAGDWVRIPDTFPIYSRSIRERGDQLQFGTPVLSDLEDWNQSTIYVPILGQSEYDQFKNSSQDWDFSRVRIFIKARLAHHPPESPDALGDGPLELQGRIASGAPILAMLYQLTNQDPETGGNFYPGLQDNILLLDLATGSDSGAQNGAFGSIWLWISGLAFLLGIGLLVPDIFASIWFKEEGEEESLDKNK